jgi:hypothetical protein
LDTQRYTLADPKALSSIIAIYKRAVKGSTSFPIHRHRQLPGFFGARVDKVGRPQEGQSASRETDRPAH